MNYEIVWSIVFALILFRIVEDGIDHVVEIILKRKRNKDFKKLVGRIENIRQEDKPSFTLDIGCNDEDCDICGDDEGTIAPARRKPVKRAATKTKAVRRPVKKTVAKKRK